MNDKSNGKPNKGVLVVIIDDQKKNQRYSFILKRSHLKRNIST